jgi:hypothetical protein
MMRLVRCDYTDLHTGETWSRLFHFRAETGERNDASKAEIENAPLPDPKRRYWGGRK